MKKKLIISFIAVVLVLSMSVAIFAACDKKDDSQQVDPTPQGPSYDELYDAVYASALGEFNSYLALAKAKSDVDERYALMAIAEAKMLEAGVYLPTTSQGGSYAVTKAVPYSVTPVLYGNDSYRLYSTIVADKLILPADRDALKALYAANKNDKNAYAAAAKAYLAANGYSVANTYKMPYSEDPSTWDITNTFRAVDSEAIVNTYDGLVVYDAGGVLRPALAESWSVSADGKKYTFNIRQGVKWVTKDGQEYAEVKAQDWVYGMERILKNNQSASLVTPLIKGAKAFCKGDTEDFSTVGVKAVSDYVLEYELNAPCAYFITLFSYNPFAPVCKAYAEAQGEDYGTAPDKILYNGPYIVSNYTKDNKIVFSKNAKYWDLESVNVDTIEWKSYHGVEDETQTYVDMKAGIIDGIGLNTSTVALAKEDKLTGDAQTIFDKYVYVSNTDATAFGFFFNIYRGAYTTDGYDDTASQKTDAQKELSKAALSNKNFRLAFARGLDRVSYNAAIRGADLASKNLQNMYTPGTFVQLSKAVTVEINGKAVAFPAGTFYGEIVQAQLNADLGDDAPLAFDVTADGGIGSSGGYDGWYDEDVALKYFAKALAELEQQGFEVSAQNPIHIDYPLWGARQQYKTRAEAMKQKFNTLFGGKVVLDLVETTQKGWYYVGYYANSGAECNYDVYDCSGWGPDYGDPETYLNTLLPEVGDMIHMLGIY